MNTQMIHEIKLKQIHIIINPAAGKKEPILPILNEVMKDTEIKWDVSVTKQAGDGYKIAKELLKKRIDAVAVYGGDGTLTEVVSALVDTDMPLIILPGGSANVLASDLGIPKSLKEACEFLSKGQFEIRAIDVGKYGRRHFILRASLGFEAQMVKDADRETKNKIGVFAYVLSAMSALKKMKLANYHISVDGNNYTVSGMTCIIANSGSIGFADLKLDVAISVSDGLLDVIVVKRMNFNLLRYIISVCLFRQYDRHYQVVKHWQGQEIAVWSTPLQIVQCDGEMIEDQTIKAKVLPKALNVIVPKKSEPSVNG